MKNFAWAPARSLAEAAAAAATLVADAMVAPADAAASIVKAGGVDVVDLMKEGLIAPAKIVSLRETPGLDAIEAGADGSLRIGAMVTLARLADDAGARKNFPALTDARRRFREPADPQRRDLGRQPAAAAALLVFPRRGLSLPAQGRRPLLRDSRRESLSRRSSTIASAPSSTPRRAATALVALGASIELVDAEGGTREVRLEDFFVSPESRRAARERPETA